MPEYIKIPKIVLKVKDVFPLNDLVKIMGEWLKEYNYQDLEESDEETPETLQSYKVSKGGSWLDAWMWWRTVKYPEGTDKKGGYIRYLLNIDMHYLGDAQEIEVLHKGKKIKLSKGEMEITISPILELDYRGEWKKEGIMGMMHEMFRKKIYRKDIDNHFEILLKEAYKFQGMLKQFFKVESFMPEETISQPPKGLM